MDDIINECKYFISKLIININICLIELSFYRLPFQTISNLKLNKTTAYGLIHINFIYDLNQNINM